jgi:heme-degrading monooxygenase HmoA
MMIRIVKLSFHEEHIETFKTIFTDSKEKIVAMKGCHKVELLHDINNPNQFFTYSWWDSQEDLNAYRESKLFKQVWQSTKTLFNDKPYAWSTEKINEAL